MATAMKSKKPTHKGGTFRIIVGEHLGDGPPGCECDACLKSAGKDHRYRSIVVKGNLPYNPYQLDEWVAGGKQKNAHPQPIGPDNPYDGDIIESKQDLAVMHNFPPGPNFGGSFKFERIDGVGNPYGQGSPYDSPPQPYPLERMNLAQLMAVAADEGIDIKGITKKEDIASAIELAREQSTRE